MSTAVVIDSIPLDILFHTRNPSQHVDSGLQRFSPQANVETHHSNMR